MVMVAEKRCSKCGYSKAAGEFYKDSSSATGLDSCCRECRRQYARNRPKRETPAVTEKMCSHCSHVKPASDFGKNARETTGLQPWCRACHSTYVNRKPKVDAPCVSEKRCSKCGVVKPANDFCKDKYKPSGLRSWCRGCRNRARAATRQEKPCVKSQKCRGCGEIKPAHLFPKCKENTSGLKSTCHKCANDRSTGGSILKRQRSCEPVTYREEQSITGPALGKGRCVLKRLSQPASKVTGQAVHLSYVSSSGGIQESNNTAVLQSVGLGASCCFQIPGESKWAPLETVGLSPLGPPPQFPEAMVSSLDNPSDTILARYVDRSAVFESGFSYGGHVTKGSLAGEKRNISRRNVGGLEGLHMLVKAAETVSGEVFRVDH